MDRRVSGGTFVTPLARRLAAEAGIDLGARHRSGPHGRIVARDVETAMARSRRRLRWCADRRRTR